MVISVIAVHFQFQQEILKF